VQKGRVVAVHPKPGKILNVGAKVALTLSRGPKG
jgi:beta-lactam-binding protein with PASTA domain